MSTNAEIIRGDEIKQGDTVPSLRVKLLEDGNPFNLDGYTVTLRMKRTDADSLLVDEASMSIENAPRGIVTYDWSSSETDTSGTYLIECVVTNGSEQITFPNDTYTKLRIMESL